MKLLYLLCAVQFINCNEYDGRNQLSKICDWLQDFVDCSNKTLKKVPSDLPHWTKKLDLTNNNLQEHGVLDILKNYPSLKELRFDWNRFSNIPITSSLPNLAKLTISNNVITIINGNFWSLVPNLKFLDISNNDLKSLGPGMFPRFSDLTVFKINDNKISSINKDSFDGFHKLKDLRISGNNLDYLGKDLFKQLINLRSLELNRNKFTRIDGLTFKGLDKLKILKIRQNFIFSLEDGSFWSLQNLQVLKLDHNKIRNISKGWTYGLSSLQKLYLGLNQIHYIERDAWEACKSLKFLDLSFNQLEDIPINAFEHLSTLHKLKLNHNKIRSILEGTFNSTPALKILDLGHNKISLLVEDPSGTFVGLKELKTLSLASNDISSINQKAFHGLLNLSELDLSGNFIKTIQENAFLNLRLDVLFMNTSSLICDCSLKWFQIWITECKLILPHLVCAYPESLKGKNFTSIPPQGFSCLQNESPKPIIIQEPESTVTVAGSDLNISCSAWSSSNSSLQFKWKQNNLDIDPINSVTQNNTAFLLFKNVSLNHAGKYQCIVNNDLGTVYSKKASLKVLILPVLVKKPVNLTVKAGSTAKLECSATGEPTPQVGWQKDGGNEFPAAQERRMHVMHSDDVFFIVNAKPIDSGLYSCIAKNSAGTVKSNATLTVQEAPTFLKKMEDKEVKIGMSTVFECLGSGWPKPKIRWWKDSVPLSFSYRHFLTAHDQLLIITDVKEVDAGTYQCEMSNLLGIEKTTAHLAIKSAYSASCDDLTGVIIISVVCCAVGTSAIWVIIIYQTRRHFSNCNNLPKHIVITRTALDAKSDNSSTSKDSGTGNSTKRSTEDFQLDVLAPQETPVDVQDISEISAQVNIPLLQNNICPPSNEICLCSQVQRENTRSNHERFKNERPFSTPVESIELPVTLIQSNSSYSCLYNSGKPTDV